MFIEYGDSKHSLATRCGCSAKIEVLNELTWRHTRDKINNRITVDMIEKLERALQLNFESLDTFEGKKFNFSAHQKMKKSSEQKPLKPRKFINPSRFLRRNLSKTSKFYDDFCLQTLFDRMKTRRYN